MLYEKITYLHAAIGLYIFFLYALHPPDPCPVSTGFYIYMSIIYPAVRPYEDIIYKTHRIKETKNSIIFYIFMDVSLFAFGLIELLRFCVNNTVMGWIIYSIINNFLFIFVHIFLVKRKNIELENTPLLEDAPESPNSDNYIDI